MDLASDLDDLRLSGVSCKGIKLVNQDNLVPKLSAPCMLNQNSQIVGLCVSKKFQ